jgi:hypothetical protein
MYSVAKLSARRAGGWSRLQILFRLAASLSPADASLFRALTSLSPADASLFHALTSLSPADASLFHALTSLSPAGASLFSSGASLFHASAREGNSWANRRSLLHPLTRVHCLGSLQARRSHLLALTPSPSPTGWERGVGDDTAVRSRGCLQRAVLPSPPLRLQATRFSTVPLKGRTAVRPVSAREACALSRVVSLNG